jgi:S1-C subfamily serine protease
MKLKSLRILAVLVPTVAIFGYGAHVSARIQALEEQSIVSEQRIQGVEQGSLDTWSQIVFVLRAHAKQLENLHRDLTMVRIQTHDQVDETRADLVKFIETIRKEFKGLTSEQMVDRYLRPVVAIEHVDPKKDTSHDLNHLLGSGVVIKSVKVNGQYDNYILTAYHVIDSSGIYRICTFDYAGGVRKYDAIVIATHSVKDLALLKCTTRNSLPAAKIADDIPSLMSPVVTVGTRTNSQIPIATFGHLAKNFSNDLIKSDHDEYWFVNAPVIFGCSGGPSYNTKGEVIGITVRLFIDPTGSPVEHVGIIIPLPEIKDFVSRFLD